MNDRSMAILICARSAKRQKVQGVVFTITAIAVGFKEKYVDKNPTKDNDSLRRQIFRCLLCGSEDICYEQLRLT